LAVEPGGGAGGAVKSWAADRTTVKTRKVNCNVMQTDDFNVSLDIFTSLLARRS
jgi:hypothetical protein